MSRIILLLFFLFSSVNAEEVLKCDYLGYVERQPQEDSLNIGRRSYMEHEPRFAYACYKLTNLSNETIRTKIIDIVEYNIDGAWYNKEEEMGGVRLNIAMDLLFDVQIQSKESLYFFLLADKQLISSVPTRIYLHFLDGAYHPVISEEKQAQLLSDDRFAGEPEQRDSWETRIGINEEATWAEVTGKMRVANKAISSNISERRGYLLQHDSFPEQIIRICIDDWAPPRSGLHLVFSQEGIEAARVTFTCEEHEPPKWYLDEPPLSLRWEDFSLVQKAICDIFYDKDPPKYDAVFVYVDDLLPVSSWWQYVYKVTKSAPFGKTIPLKTPLPYLGRKTKQSPPSRDISPWLGSPPDIHISID